MAYQLLWLLTPVIGSMEAGEVRRLLIIPKEVFRLLLVMMALALCLILLFMPTAGEVRNNYVNFMRRKVRFYLFIVN